MMRAGIRLLVVLLVPVVIFANPTLASAANGNPWQTDTVHLSFKLQDVDCEVISRYAADGEAIQWQDSGCHGGIDYAPGALPMEEGGKAALRFSGFRQGEPAELPYVLQSPNSMGLPSTDCVNIDFGASSGLTRSSSSITVVLKNTCTTSQSASIDWQCVNLSNVNGGGGGSGGVGNLAPGGTATATKTCAAGYYVGLFAVYQGAQNGHPAGYDQYKITQFTGPVVNTEGAGEGNPCTVETPELPLLAHADDGLLGIASTIPGGSVAFPNDLGGACLVTEVCVGYLWDAGNHWLPGEQVGGAIWGCEAVEFGLPVAPGSSEAAPPPAGSSPEVIADPVTEQSFWGKILNALLALGRLIWRGLMAVVDAVKAVASSILDGLSALFVPSAGSWGFGGLSDQFMARPPGSVLASVGSGMSGFADGFQAGGCGVIADFGVGGEITCSNVKSIPGYGGLYALVQVGLFALTGLAIFRTLAGKVGGDTEQ